MSEPSSIRQGVPSPSTPEGEGNRAKLPCNQCGKIAPLWFKADDHPKARADLLLCAKCYEDRYGLVGGR